MKKTFEITTITGKELKITINNTYAMLGVCGECDPEKRKHNVTVITTALNGQTVYLKVYKVYESTKGGHADKCREAGVSFYFTAGNAVIIPTADSIKEMIKFMDNDEDAEAECRKAIAGNESTEMTEEKEQIIASAKNTIKNADGSLMTNEQARKFTKEYNDFYNEGGEGFLPVIITAEMVKWARKRRYTDVRGNC